MSEHDAEQKFWGIKRERETENGWDHRYLWIGRFLVGWATLVPGEPWEGPWIGVRFANSKSGVFARFGVRGFACAIGVAK